MTETCPIMNNQPIIPVSYARALMTPANDSVAWISRTEKGSPRIRDFVMAVWVMATCLSNAREGGSEIYLWKTTPLSLHGDFKEKPKVNGSPNANANSTVNCTKACFMNDGGQVRISSMIIPVSYIRSESGTTDPRIHRS